jgi:hypothetical protein
MDKVRKLKKDKLDYSKEKKGLDLRLKDANLAL